MPFLPPNQQRQSTEGTKRNTQKKIVFFVVSASRCIDAGLLLYVCKLNIVLISLWGLMHKIHPTSRYQNVSSLCFWDQYYNIAPYFPRHQM